MDRNDDQEGGHQTAEEALAELEQRRQMSFIGREDDDA
jgi:hypothetical protein